MIKRLLAVLLLVPFLLGQDYNVPFNPPGAACASPAPASITFWFNGDNNGGGATSSPSAYTLSSTTEYSADADKTGTFATTAPAVETVANAAFGTTNVLKWDLSGADASAHLAFTETSGNIIGTQYGRIGCYTEFDIDPTGAGSPRLFEYINGSSQFIRILHFNTQQLWASISTSAQINLTSADPLTSFDAAGEQIFWEFSWDTAADSYALYVNGSSVATSATAIGNITASSGEIIKLGNSQGSITPVFQYLQSMCIIATGTAGRDLNLYNIVVTTGIRNYNACNFP